MTLEKGIDVHVARIFYKLFLKSLSFISKRNWSFVIIPKPRPLPILRRDLGLAPSLGRLPRVTISSPYER